MGYRCTLVSSDRIGNGLPVWFKEKYDDRFFFSKGLMVSSKQERKFYDNEFFEDYQKAIIESGFWNEKYPLKVFLALLGDDGAVFKVIISPTEIKYFLMCERFETDEILTYTGSN